jgi:hypothetical protein
MKRAVTGLVALSVLCVPAILSGQEEAFKSRAAKALVGFGDLFRRTCYPDLSPRLRIAVTEMKPSRTLRDSAARFVTNRIEEALENEFVVVPRRLNAELAEARKELQESRPSAPGAEVHGIITIEPEGDASGKPSVKVAAFSANLECQRTAQSLIPVGDIKDPLDDPDAFFKDAAKKLPDKNVERVVVMPPAVGRGIDRAMVQRLQKQLVTAIRNTFQSRSFLHGYEEPIPPVELDDVGMADAGAWQARLHLDPSSQGTDVRVEFRGPASHPGGFDVTGHFASESFVAAQAWAATKDTTSIAVLDEFIRQFGDTPYGSMAWARREELRPISRGDVQLRPPDRRGV